MDKETIFIDGIRVIKGKNTGLYYVPVKDELEALAKGRRGDLFRVKIFISRLKKIV